MPKDSMLFRTKSYASSLRIRLDGAYATLSLLRDLGMSTREQEDICSALKLRLESIERDIHILEGASV